MNKNAGDDPVMHEREGSLASGWPAYLLVLIVLAAAVYAFSPRPLPPFPPTMVHPSDLLVTGLAQSGQRIIAAGEQGHILIADSPHGPWREAKVEPQRGSTLTRVLSIGNGVLIAGGHDGWIVRSEDNGEHWKEVAFNDQQSDPVLDLAGPYNGKLYAVGAFGMFQTSADGGRTWTRENLNITPAGGAAKTPAPSSADPFATAAGGGNDLGTRHLYGLVQAADGSLLLVGERGLMARSSDGGQNWQELPQIYKGSFFGALRLPDNTLLVYGMRGHAFTSRDNGRTWQASEMPGPTSVYGGTSAGGSDVVLVGASNGIFVSSDDGAHFKRISPDINSDLSAVLPVQGGWLTAGTAGLHLSLSAAGK